MSYNPLILDGVGLCDTYTSREPMYWKDGQLIPVPSGIEYYYPCRYSPEPPAIGITKIYIPLDSDFYNLGDIIVEEIKRNPKFYSGMTVKAIVDAVTKL